MSRIKHVFEQLQQAQKTALIPYITAGDPKPEHTVAMMHQLVASGADMIELGVPFSDPMADGPVIQAAYERALVHGVDIEATLAMVKAFRRDNQTTPIILMGYMNPIEQMGYYNFREQVSQAGVDGVIVVDLTVEECQPFQTALAKRDIDMIFLMAPTTSDERITQIVEHASGYIYYVSLKGVTGSNKLQSQQVADKVANIRQKTTLPIAVGFGIRDAESAANVAQCADAVIVGSAIVQKMVDNCGDADKMQQQVGNMVSEMRCAMDNCTMDNSANNDRGRT